MRASFFRKARRKQGVTLRMGSQPIVVKVRARVLLDGEDVTGTFDPDTGVIEIKEGPIASMRDTLAHELLHAAVRVYRLTGVFAGADDDERTKSEEQFAHTFIPSWLGAVDACK